MGLMPHLTSDRFDPLHSHKSRSEARTSRRWSRDRSAVHVVRCVLHSRRWCASTSGPTESNRAHLFTVPADDDWDVFTQRHAGSSEVTLLLTGPSIPMSNPSIASMSSLPPSSAADGASLYSSTSYGRGQTRDVRTGTSMHLLSASGSVKSPVLGPRSLDGKTAEEASMKNGAAKSIAPSVPEHKIKFEEFHNQVRRGH